MNTPSPTVTTPAASSDEGGIAGTIEQRQAALAEELRAELSEPTGEVEGGESRPAAAPPAASPVDSDEEKRRADRRARLDAFKAEERQKVDHKERQAYADKLAQRAKEAEERIAALSGSTFDRAVLKDPVAVMRLMEKEGIGADKVAEAIRESMTNPDIAASRAAREAVTPEIQALREQLTEQNKQIAALLERDAKATAAAQEREYTERFVSHATTNAARAPLAASLLKHDRAEFLEIASLAGERVPPGAGPDALLDAVEDILDSDVRQVAQKYAAIYGPQALPSPATQPRSGAVQPTTVSNSLAQERGSLVDEDDYAKLPVEERAKRLIRAM